MLSIQYYPFGCQNGQQNRQHTSLRIARSTIPVLFIYAVHSALQSSFQAQYSTTHQAAWAHRLGGTSLEDWATRRKTHASSECSSFRTPHKLTLLRTGTPGFKHDWSSTCAVSLLPMA